MPREDPEEVVHREAHVGAIGRGAPHRDPELPQQPHDMVDPQHPRMPHIGAQRSDQRGKAAPPQRQRVERRQSPILARPAQRVGRRADRGPADDQLAVGPGLGAVRIGPLSSLALEDDFGEQLLKLKGSIDPDIDLEF